MIKLQVTVELETELSIGGAALSVEHAVQEAFESADCAITAVKVIEVKEVAKSLPATIHLTEAKLRALLSIFAEVRRNGHPVEPAYTQALVADIEEVIDQAGKVSRGEVAA